MIQQWTSRRGLRLLPYQVHDFTVTEESGLATIVSRDMKKKKSNRKLAGRKNSLSSNDSLGNDVFRKGLPKDSLHIWAEMIYGYLQ